MNNDEYDPRLIIGIDLHGTIDKDPDYFRSFLKKCLNLNIIVYIISGPPIFQIKKELDILEFYINKHYNKIISVVDFLKTHDVKMWQDEKGNWWTDENIWWSSKAHICRTFNVDIMIDDKKEYKKYFNQWMKTKFVLWR